MDPMNLCEEALDTVEILASWPLESFQNHSTCDGSGLLPADPSVLLFSNNQEVSSGTISHSEPVTTDPMTVVEAHDSDQSSPSSLLVGSARKLLVVLDTYNKVGVSAEPDSFDQDFEQVVQQALDVIVAPLGGEDLLRQWIVLVGGGARRQYEVFVEMEKFVLDYSTYLAAFDLVFGCLPDDRPTWASPAAPASRREDDAAEGDSPRKENAGVENSSNQAMKEKKAKKAKKTSGGRTVFRAEQQKTLLTWLRVHQDNPYPSKMEKDELMVETGMSRIQVENWFINGRRRYLPLWKTEPKLSKW